MKELYPSVIEKKNRMTKANKQACNCQRDT